MIELITLYKGYTVQQLQMIDGIATTPQEKKAVIAKMLELQAYKGGAGAGYTAEQIAGALGIAVPAAPVAPPAPVMAAPPAPPAPPAPVAPPAPPAPVVAAPPAPPAPVVAAPPAPPAPPAPVMAPPPAPMAVAPPAPVVAAPVLPPITPPALPPTTEQAVAAQAVVNSASAVLDVIEKGSHAVLVQIYNILSEHLGKPKAVAAPAPVATAKKPKKKGSTYTVKTDAEIPDFVTLNVAGVPQKITIGQEVAVYEKNSTENIEFTGYVKSVQLDHNKPNHFYLGVLRSDTKKRTTVSPKRIA